MKLQDATQPHINAYNALFKNNIFRNILKKTRTSTFGDVKMEIIDYNIHLPYNDDTDSLAFDRRLLPAECRLTNSTYRGKIFLKINIYFKDKLIISELKHCGFFPIMVRSGFCHLSEEDNYAKIGEDDNEVGGYFIVNGIDRVVRFMVAQKRNYIFAYIRESRVSWLTKFLISIRSVGDDEIGVTNFLHYTTDGSVIFKFFIKRVDYFVPVGVILKSLINTTDEEIFDLMNKDPFIAVTLRKGSELGIFSQKECIDYMGSKFKGVCDCATNEEACIIIFKNYILPHLKSNTDKFNFLILAIRKLLLLVKDEIIPDDPDSPSNHEIFTVTQFFAIIFKEKIDYIYKSFRFNYLKVLGNIKQTYKKRGSENETVSVNKYTHLSDHEKVKKAYQLVETQFSKPFETFLSSGNLNPTSCSDLLEKSGFCILAERVNFYRFISHFRCVNRGSFFSQLRTTTVRKLRPESWGFICPVHTPDGTPCGLLTHLSLSAEIVCSRDDFDPEMLYEIGVTPIFKGIKWEVPVLYNGIIMGSTYCPEVVVEKLRCFRTENNLKIEIVYNKNIKMFEQICIFNTISRLTRKVKNLNNGADEWIGIMEQVFLKIRLKDHNRYMIGNKNEANEEYTHEELDNLNVMSIVASLTPYFAYNQSPRSMYQCQMAKQSMGIPAHNIKYRADNKSYILNYLHHPIVHTKNHKILEDYPLGINCIVAVLSYTAYDMEDAMVINKGSMERGLFTGYVYKKHVIELKNNEFFSYLPEVGHTIKYNDVLYKSLDISGKETVHRYKDSEVCVVDTIDIFNVDGLKANIKLRIVRNPNIGDKFCSRHGQKGVCSAHWPTIDMPFSESGLVPDIIINPHAFPSRMTIGMLIENMAGKSGSFLGEFQDATAFEKNTFLHENGVEENFSKKKESIEDDLRKCGFNYYGNEPMYSGVYGTEFRTDIFIGVVFYQRLRHMVNDKFQVRTTGAVVGTTQQPIGGRKQHGGVRFGEMERDALIAHGTPYLLNDRLLYCSDYSTFNYCCSCKSILFVSKNQCACGNRELKIVEMPYVFKYLCSELLSMNIKVSIDLFQPE